ncbi:unnamed protein product [Angiostrongylus costaricensis]|uniref:28S ribosomal protein S24, mitochondrial n=1 Tax=Angiostrongylus costaricensis TaxID=334426 RepID=A0A0R3PEI3_ANGCS|nr:unnamed protein product [Angiostrongylus costaricensis]
MAHQAFHLSGIGKLVRLVWKMSSTGSIHRLATANHYKDQIGIQSPSTILNEAEYRVYKHLVAIKLQNAKTFFTKMTIICVDNPLCPMSPGREVLDFSFDPSLPSTRLFRRTHNKVSAYQVCLRYNRDWLKDLLNLTVHMRMHF